MKTNPRFMLGVAILLVTFANAQAGRWLSRDPIEEGAGFVQREPVEEDLSLIQHQQEATHSSSLPLRHRNEPNLYAFVRNDVSHLIDPLGLISFNGCASSQEAALTDAWNAACRKVNDPKFACCLGSSTFASLMKRRCAFGNIRFYCRNNGTPLCNSVTCAHAWLSIAGGINVGRIVVCYPLSQNCGMSQPCLLLHELAHIVNASPFEGPNSSAVRAENCCANNE